MAHVTYGGYRPPQAAAHPQAHYPQGAHLQQSGHAQPDYAAHPEYAAPQAPYASRTESPAAPAAPAHGRAPQGYAPQGQARLEPQTPASFGYPEPQGYAPHADPYSYQPGPAPRVAEPDPAGPGMGRLVNLAGAVVSVALLLGVGLWSYRLMVRDVSGVPVIQALEGPIRRSPDDPGGRQAPYQELSVNTVAAQGEAAGAARIVAVAPPPVQLSEEDRTIAELQGAQITAPSTPATLAPQPVAQAPTPVEPVQAVADPTPAPLALVPATAPGVARSPLPPRRPGAVIRIAAAAPTPAPQTQPGGVDAQAEAVLQDLVTRLGPTNVSEIDAASLAPGTRLVQLSVYESAEDARRAWDQLAARFPAYLDGRSRIVDSASAGGRTFYRLRAHGFVDEPEARRFCSIFLAQGVDCIPVLTGR